MRSTASIETNTAAYETCKTALLILGVDLTSLEKFHSQFPDADYGRLHTRLQKLSEAAHSFYYFDDNLFKILTDQDIDMKYANFQRLEALAFVGKIHTIGAHLEKYCRSGEFEPIHLITLLEYALLGENQESIAYIRGIIQSEISKREKKGYRAASLKIWTPYLIVLTNLILNAAVWIPLIISFGLGMIAAAAPIFMLGLGVSAIAAVCYTSTPLEIKLTRKFGNEDIFSGYRYAIFTNDSDFISESNSYKGLTSYLQDLNRTNALTKVGDPHSGLFSTEACDILKIAILSNNPAMFSLVVEWNGLDRRPTVEEDKHKKSLRALAKVCGSNASGMTARVETFIQNQGRLLGQSLRTPSSAPVATLSSSRRVDLEERKASDDSAPLVICQTGLSPSI